MEASGGVAQTGGEVQGDPGGQAAAPAQQQGGQDIGALVERFNDFASDFGEKFEGLESRLADPGLGGDPAAAQGGLETGDIYTDGQGGFFDAYGNPVDPAQAQPQQDPQALREQLSKEYDDKLQKALSPILEHFKDQQLGQLEDKYPDFRDQKNAEKIIEAADGLAAKIGHPEAAEHPALLEVMLLAQKALKAAESETPASAEENEVQPESASGSNPGAAEQDPGDRIVAASRRGSGFFS